MSSPAGRTLAPGLRPAGSTTLSPSTRTSSCMNTVSAPSGIGAPVKMRIACPGLSGAFAEPPAWTRPVTGNACSSCLRQVAARDRIAVDGGIGEGRQRQRRQNVVRENAAIGARERDRLDIHDRRHARGDETDGLIDRHHRPAEGKAIVGQLRHVPDQPSASHFASTSSSEIADFSIIAATASISSRWAVGSVVSTAVSVAMPTMPGSSGNSSGFSFAAR